MKKHNEGYTLVLVLIVLIVLSLLATYVLTFSLRNLHTQKAAAIREQSYYTAVGETEAVVGSFRAFAEKNQGAALTAFFNEEEHIFLLTTTEEFQKKESERTEENWFGLSGVKAVTLKVEEQNLGRLSLDLVLVSGVTQIDCTLRLLATVSLTQEKGLYTLSDFNGVEYASYSISMVEGGEAVE